MIEFKNKDGNFYLYPNDAIAKHVMSGLLWEEHFTIIVSKLLPKSGVVLDCGANFGYNSVVMGNMLSNSNNAKLICFEPQRKICQQLRLNLDLNNIKNYEVYCNCLAEKSNNIVQLNPVNYDLSWVNIGDTSIGSGGEESTTIAIDDLNLSDVSFMKIDVQGYEPFVIRGASNTIKRCNPIIFIELESHQLIKFGFTKEHVISLLKEFGYLVYNIDLPTYKDDYLCVKTSDTIKTLENILLLKEV
jgi:FkbM family methyltransferase